MRKKIGTLTLVATLAIGLGLYRGWFHISSTQRPGETNVHVKIDREKIKEDTQKAGEKAKEIGDEIGERLSKQE